MPLLSAFSSKLLTSLGVSSGELVFLWELVKSSANETQGLHDAAYSSYLNLYIRVGSSGLIQTSPDLLTWTTRDGGTSQDLYSIVYSNNFKSFYAVGANKTVLASANGIN